MRAGGPFFISGRFSAPEKGETDDGGEDKDRVAEVGDDCAQGQQEGCMGVGVSNLPCFRE